MGNLSNNNAEDIIEEEDVNNINDNVDENAEGDIGDDHHRVLVKARADELAPPSDYDEGNNEDSTHCMRSGRISKTYDFATKLS